MEELLMLYYNNTPPSNIKIYFLEEEEYVKKYKEICKKINKEYDDDYLNTSGYYFFDSNNYYILIKKYPNLDCDNVYILNLFHELSHIETMPNVNLEKVHRKTAAYCGYDFWREYIAQYTAINQYQMKIGDIAFLKDEDETKKVLKNLYRNFNDTLYEIILYSEITSIYIHSIREQSIELIALLKSIKNKFTSKQDIKNISINDLNKIGKIVNDILMILNFH